MWHLKWCWCCLFLVQCLTVLCTDPCSTKVSCRECIGTPNCYWCTGKITGEENDVHCVNKSKVVDEWCSKENKEEPYTEYVVKKNNNSHQIQPQRSHLKLRLGEEKKIEIKFVKSRNYPVDLYYLMDLSKSMEDDKAKLSTLGDELTETMKNLTNNFHLGFGSFVDKTTLPYVSTVPSKLKKPCDKCAPPYSFKNHMPLDNNTVVFKDKVMSAPVSGNLDSPEGGFDALMQAMVCTKRIKWREDARRLLVFSTDAQFHLAGDGRLAGIIEPNDGLCHMNEKEEYTDGLLYDYPSIAQLDNKAVENNINIIFAVAENQMETYKYLAQYITGSSCGKLSEGSQNVVDLVYAQSKKLTQTVTIIGNADQKVEVRYYSSCFDPDGKIKETDKCDRVKGGDTITFEARIKVSECPVNNVTVWKSTLQFKPMGINETLEVELEVFCGCDCENNVQKNSSMCHYGGILKCGVCECDKGFTGQFCQCSESDTVNVVDDRSCRMDNSSKKCSDHGECKCGVCDCYKNIDKGQLYSGKFCECDNYSCVRHDNKVCGGPSNGKCKCGKCYCLQGWKGEACQIRDNVKDCIDPATGQVCAGRGICEDGKCICDKQKYHGKYCEDCVFCSGGHCKELGDCVECLVYQTGQYADSCESHCNVTITDIVDKLTEEDAGTDEHFCQLPSGTNCTIMFIYRETKGFINITAQSEKECRGVESVLAVVFGAAGSTIAIGLLILLIWKLLTTVHDHREYSKFEKERAQAKFDRGENPLYRGAVTKFDNPTFSGN